MPELSEPVPVPKDEVMVGLVPLFAGLSAEALNACSLLRLSAPDVAEIAERFPEIGEYQNRLRPGREQSGDGVM